MDVVHFPIEFNNELDDVKKSVNKFYMGSEHIAATEKGEQFQATLDGALDAVEHQVREVRKQQRGY